MREWYILIKDQRVGPLTLEELKQHPNFNPDSFVWKKDFQCWIKARYVSELQDAFKDKNLKPIWSDQDHTLLGEKKGEKGYLVLTLQHDPYQFLLWIILLILTLFYVIYEIQ